MRSLLAGLWLLLAIFLSPHRAEAQAIVLPCVPSGNSCIPVSAANPLPITGGGGIPASCVTANGVVFNNATACDSGLTYAGSGGAVSLAGAALAGTTGFLMNPASASGNIMDVQIGSVSKLKVLANGNTTLGGVLTTNQVNVSSGANVLILGASNGIFLGSSSNTSLCWQGAGVLEIGTTACNASGSLLATGITGTGTITFSGLSTGTNADFLCLSAGGVVLLQTTACTISSLRFKQDWKLFEEDAIASILRLDVGTFHINETISNQRDPNARSLQIGLNAENVARIVPEAAVYEDDMRTPKSYRQEGIIALLVKAIQQQQAEIEVLKRRLP